MNDSERAQWIANDEGLHDLQRRSRLSERAWIRANRALIDSVATGVTEGTQSAHDLKYGKRR